jgi:hypothetical protein
MKVAVEMTVIDKRCDKLRQSETTVGPTAFRHVRDYFILRPTVGVRLLDVKRVQGETSFA